MNHDEQTANLRVVQLYVENHGTLKEHILETCPTLTTRHSDEVLSELGRNLSSYTPALFSEPDALDWMCSWVQREARRKDFLIYQLWRYEKALLAKARRALFRCFAKDEAYEAGDIVSDFVLLLLTSPHKVDAIVADSKPGNELFRQFRGYVSGTPLKRFKRRHWIIRRTGATLEKRLSEVTDDPAERRMLGMDATLPKSEKKSSA